MEEINVKKVELAEEVDKALNTDDPFELYNNLEGVYRKHGMKMPWGDQDPDEFFANRDNQLVFD